MALTPANFDIIERVFKLLRELFLLGVGVYLAVFLLPLLPQLVGQIDGAKLSEVELGGVKLKLQEAEQALEAAVRTQAPKTGNADTSASEQTILVAKALSSVRSAAQQSVPQPLANTKSAIETLAPITYVIESSTQSYWVYVGAYRDGVWLTKYFDISAMPAAGDVVRATKDVFKRQSSPTFKSTEWTLGSPLGVLQVGERVQVIRLENVPGTEGRSLIWAEVKAR